MSTTPREPFLGSGPVMCVDKPALIQTDPTEMGTAAKLGAVSQRIQ